MLDLLIEKNKKSKSPFSRELTNNLAPLVLIADDDTDSREMLQFLLETWNFRVIEATDGIEAVSIAEKENPDLILMDVKMPIRTDSTRRGVSANRRPSATCRSSFSQAAPKRFVRTLEASPEEMSISSNRLTLKNWKRRSVNTSAARNRL